MVLFGSVVTEADSAHNGCGSGGAALIEASDLKPLAARGQYPAVTVVRSRQPNELDVQVFSIYVLIYILDQYVNANTDLSGVLAPSGQLTLKEAGFYYSLVLVALQNCIIFTGLGLNLRLIFIFSWVPSHFCVVLRPLKLNQSGNCLSLEKEP
jgi:hypothetical protein